MRWAAARFDRRATKLGPTRHVIDLRHLDPRGRGRRFAACGVMLEYFPGVDRWDPTHPRNCIACLHVITNR
jgi:hypothetical protein